MRPSIHIQINKKDRNLDYWEVGVKHVMDAEAKTGQKAPSLVCESDTCYHYSHTLFQNEESKDQNNSETKKNDS